MTLQRFRYLLAALLALSFVAGCGKEGDKKPSTQVAAKVNGDEITVHQVNAVLGRTSDVTPDRAAQVKREALERLVEQQLAMQQALHKKLDRTPGVQLALESARREILARAYLDQVVALQAKPTEEEGKKYYAAHPELFSQRRVFVFEELAVNLDESAVPALKERISKARSLKEVADWLQARGIPFAPNRVVAAAEQIPLEVLPRFHAAKDGDILLLENGKVRRVMRLAGSRTEPVDEATAMPRILQFLANRRAREVSDAELKQLKAGAQLQYVGEFESAAAAEAAAKAAAAEKARSTVEAKARAQAEEEAKAAEATRARLAEARVRQEAEERERAATQKAPALPQDVIKKGIGALK